MVCLSPRHGGGPRSEFITCVLSILPLTIGYIGTAERTGVRTWRFADHHLPPPSRSRSAPPPFGIEQVAFNREETARRKRTDPGKERVGFSFGVFEPVDTGSVLNSCRFNLRADGPGSPLPCELSRDRNGPQPPRGRAARVPFCFSELRPKEFECGPTARFALVPGWPSFRLCFLTLQHAGPCNPLGLCVHFGEPRDGGGLLLAYAAGYVTPLLVAATATENLKRIPAIRKYSQWINPASGMLLVAGGTYFFLDSVTATLPA